jgi:hypothetical protein
LIEVGIGVLSGFIIFGITSFIVRSEEMLNFSAILKSFFRKKPPLPPMLSYNGESK